MLWATEGRNAPSASVVAAGSHLVFLTTEVNNDRVSDRSGDVRGAASLPGRRQRHFYAHPIVLRDRVIVRDQSALTEWTLR